MLYLVPHFLPTNVVHKSTCSCGLGTTTPIATVFELQSVLSSNNTKSTCNFHKESGLDAAREHLCEFAAAKTRRTVAAGSGTEAGVVTRRKRKSSTQATSGTEGSDRAPLVPKSLHRTTEERWQGEQSSRIEAEPRDRIDTNDRG